MVASLYKLAGPEIAGKGRMGSMGGRLRSTPAYGFEESKFGGERPAAVIEGKRWLLLDMNDLGQTSVERPTKPDRLFADNQSATGPSRRQENEKPA